LETRRSAEGLCADWGSPTGTAAERGGPYLKSGDVLEAGELRVRAGEIVGLAGLVGSGRSRLLRSLAGAADGGVVAVGGRPVAPSLRARVGAGVVLVPEERKAEGLVLRLPVRANTTLAVIATNARLRKVDCTKVAQMAHDGLARAIKPVHLTRDGDTIFALSTAPGQLDPRSLAVLSVAAEDVLSRAIIRAVQRATYNDLMDQQIETAIANQGAGDLDALFRQGDTWEVE